MGKLLIRVQNNNVISGSSQRIYTIAMMGYKNNNFVPSNESSMQSKSSSSFAS